MQFSENKRCGNLFGTVEAVPNTKITCGVHPFIKRIFKKPFSILLNEQCYTATSAMLATLDHSSPGERSFQNIVALVVVEEMSYHGSVGL